LGGSGDAEFIGATREVFPIHVSSAGAPFGPEDFSPYSKDQEIAGVAGCQYMPTRAVAVVFDGLDQRTCIGYILPAGGK